jgi:hypothetical protein
MRANSRPSGNRRRFFLSPAPIHQDPTRTPRAGDQTSNDAAASIKSWCHNEARSTPAPGTARPLPRPPGMAAAGAAAGVGAVDGGPVGVQVGGPAGEEDGARLESWVGPGLARPWLGMAQLQQLSQVIVCVTWQSPQSVRSGVGHRSRGWPAAQVTILPAGNRLHWTVVQYLSVDPVLHYFFALPCEHSSHR